MKTKSALSLVFLSLALGACNDSPVSSGAPTTSQAPPAPATAAPTATARDTTPARIKGPVPFVSPTKAGRILGSQTPSPPASRTR